MVTAMAEIGTKKTDSGTITFNINPTNIFSLSPSYDIRRTLERREDQNQSTSFVSNVATEPETPEEESAEEVKWSIAEREHRLSLTPRLNRDLLGMRPTVTSRMSFRENWFREQKNAYLNGNVSVGVNLRVQKWFEWLFRKETPETESQSNGSQDGTAPPRRGEVTSPAELLEDDHDAETIEQLRANGIDETQIQELEENRGDWIERDKIAVSKSCIPISQ